MSNIQSGYTNIINYSKNHCSKIYSKMTIPIVIYLIVILLLVIAIIIWAIWRERTRLPRLLKPLETYTKFVNIKPLISLKSYKANPKKYLVCDWYVASSYKPYLPGLQYYDYSATKSIEILLRSGVRFLDLDIFNSNDNNNEPIVTVGTEKGNWHYTLNQITFEECCNIIYNIGFSKSAITNSDDPLYLSLNLYVNKNTKTLERMADILYQIFEKKLLDKKYSYQRVNIAIQPIYKFINKIIIISGPGHKGTKLSEFINISWDGPFLRRLNNKEAIQTYEPADFTDYNRLNLTIVYPEYTGRKSENYGPGIPWLYGCQFVLLNYQTMDKHMNVYMEQFRYKSFALKPLNLRYQHKYYPKPKKQKKKLYYNALQMKTQFYNYKI